MNVPAEMLEQLKCHKCGMYLSRGPVYLEHDGAAMCGVCFSPERPATRNKEYEAVVQLLKFPCKNKELGCEETVGSLEVGHEARCPYRQYECPVLSSSGCEWLGSKTQLLQHCQDQHPDHVLDNPSSLTHDITTSSQHNYVVQAYQLLFLLLTKVCMTSGRIYHLVRLLDRDDVAQDFAFKVNFKRGKEVIKQQRYVAGQDSLTLLEPMALWVSINTALCVLDGWDGASCTVQVVRKWKEKCCRCRMNVAVRLYFDERGWYCRHCAPRRQICENLEQGCIHRDLPSKCKKHKTYFCQQRSECYICDEKIPRGTLSAHYTSAHSDVTYDAGSTWRATLGTRCCLVTNPAGIAVCWYSMRVSEFILQIYIPVLSEELCKFRYEVIILEPSTRLARTYLPHIMYKNPWDFRFVTTREDCPAWTCELDISVNISEI